MTGRRVVSLILPALAACLAAVPIMWAAPAGQAETAKIEYEVVDGAVLVFGHRLETRNRLPKIGDCEDCTAIGFHYSPDGRWILIESDVRFTDNDIWLYDTRTGAMPNHVVDKRHGKHLETNWLSDRIFEVRWIGMGYSRSLLFDAENSGSGKALADLMLYDAERDVYVRYQYDKSRSSDMIEIGSVFSAANKAERFPIALDYKYYAEWMFQVESVAIEGSRVVVTHLIKGDKVTVRSEFSPQVLSGAQ